MEPDAGPSVPPALRARRFDRPPAAADFSTNIEPANVPAVFPGAVKDWKAFSNWNPLHGGLDYLQERVGSASVEAMRSSSAPVFYGDLRGHERVSLSFSTFINCCKFYLQTMDSADGSLVHKDSVVAPTILEEACSTSLDTPDQYYLAQVPILNTENTEGCPLEVLQEDIQMPMFLARTTLASVNLWMNRARSRSSAHYDPHHNLLCVVAGCKEVVLWPPSACRFLYPMPIYGEASNHSAVDLENPDFSVHLRSKYSKEYSQKVILHSGDALFIPEGWFHQVDSEDLTIAVNFWWKSNMMSNMLEHMDAYYLRRILNRLVDNEMTRMLPRSTVGSLNGIENPQMATEVVKVTESHEPTSMLSRSTVGSLNGIENRQLATEVVKVTESHEPTNKAVEGCETFDSIEHKEILIGHTEKHGLSLHQLEPLALSTLHKLISMVHDSVQISGQNLAVDPTVQISGQDLAVEPTGTNDLAAERTCTKDVVVDPRNEHKYTALNNSSLLEKDPVASILSSVESPVLQKVLLAMVHNFPRTLEALILHMLSPAAAEVLTRKFDEIDQQTPKEQQNEFYEQFYNIFDDQYAAMEAILNGKESFAFQAFQRVLDQYVGVTIDKPK